MPDSYMICKTERVTLSNTNPNFFQIGKIKNEASKVVDTPLRHQRLKLVEGGRPWVIL